MTLIPKSEIEIKSQYIYTLMPIEGMIACWDVDEEDYQTQYYE